MRAARSYDEAFRAIDAWLMTLTEKQLNKVVIPNLRNNGVRRRVVRNARRAALRREVLGARGSRLAQRHRRELERLQATKVGGAS